MNHLDRRIYAKRRLRDKITDYLNRCHDRGADFGECGPEYLKLLVETKRFLGGCVPPDLRPPKPEPPKLTKAEGRSLYILANERALLDPDGDSGVIHRLQTKGCVDRWLKVTRLGHAALCAFERACKKGDA